MNYEQGHDTWMMSPDSIREKEECPRCHRVKPLGTCEDLCRMCQSCFHKVWGMGELPSDSMEFMVEEETNSSKRIFSLVKEIWGKHKTSKGFNWIAAKYGPHWSKAMAETQLKIISCLESKRDQSTCPLHNRIHDAKV